MSLSNCEYQQNTLSAMQYLRSQIPTESFKGNYSNLYPKIRKDMGWGGVRLGAAKHYKSRKAQEEGTDDGQSPSAASD